MASQFVEAQIAAHKVVVFSKSYCSFCRMAKKALEEAEAVVYVIELDERDDCDMIQDVLLKLTGARSVPRVFIDGTCIGGGSETKKLHETGKLREMVKYE